MIKKLGIFVVCCLLGVFGVSANDGGNGQNKNTQKIDKSNSSFQADLFSGIASYSYPIGLPRGPQDFSPGLSLDYNSAKADYLNESGYGFEINIQSIFRSTRKGQDKLYTTDEFAINASFVNNELQKNASGTFVGIMGNDNSSYTFENDAWRVTDREGNTYYFGENENSKLKNPNNNMTFRYLLSRQVNQFGKEIKYSYEFADNTPYLSRIEYGFLDGVALYKIDLEYLQKDFSAVSYISGFKAENHKLLKQVSISVRNNQTYQQIKKYVLEYKDVETIFPKLIKIVERSENTIKNTTSFSYYSSGIGINLLQKIENGKGGTILLEYKAASTYKNTTVPFLLKTLYKVTYKDSVTGLQNSTTYDYFGGNFYFDPTNIYQRGYTGFSKVKIIDADGSYKISYFHQSETDKNNSQDTQKGEYQDHISKKGKIYREEEYDENDILYTTKITKWTHESKGGNRYFVFPQRVVNILWNANKNHIDTAQEMIYDTWGNIIQGIDYGLVEADVNTGDFSDIANDTKTQEIEYVQTSTNTHFHKPSQVVVTGNSGNMLSKEQYLYDNLSLGQVSKGLLTKQKIWFAEEQRFLDKTNSYTQGNLTAQTDEIGNTTSFTYDEYGLFPVEVKNPKNWKEIFIYDYAVQKPVEVVGVNGVKTLLEYDDFGINTKKSIVNPENNTSYVLETTIVNYESIPNFVEVKTFSNETVYKNMRVYYDGFEKDVEIKSSTKYLNRYSTVKTRYDKDGNKEFITYEKFEDGIGFTSIESGEKGNSFTYDVFGRVKTQTNKTGVTTFSYDLLKTTSMNQKGIKKEIHKDIFGNLVKVVEYNAGQAFTTLYIYNQNNRLISYTDALGNVRSLVYDSLSRVISMEDLHSTTQQNPAKQFYFYNDLSQLIEKKVLSGESILYKYDTLGRLVKKTSGGVENIFLYDVGSFAKGQLTTTQKPGLQENFSYNFLGQKVQTEKNYNGKIFVMQYEYDLGGNLKKITYPDATQTHYTYENTFLKGVSYNTGSIIQNIEYAPNNQAFQYQYQNGLVTLDTLDYEYGYRIKERKANIGATQLQNMRYEFNEVGNMTSLVENAPTVLNKQVSYVYDDIGRMTQANYVGENNVSTLYQYSYDAIGNILSNHLGNFSYVGGTNPHAVTSIGTGITLGYDINGNVNQENFLGTLRNYTYSPEQELLQTQNEGSVTNYHYDVSLIRSKKHTTSETQQQEVFYVNDFFEQELNGIVSSGTLVPNSEKTSKYIFIGTDKIATISQISGQNEEKVYHLKDHLGGASIDVSEAGVILQAVDYAPYGSNRVRNTQENYKNHYLFTGKELDDESNLQYFEARYYNGELGRFYSQDRVFWELGNTKRGLEFLEDPQQFNSYSYARNNPILYTDPSGESANAIKSFLSLAGGLALSDGPFPFGDIAGGVVLAGAGAYEAYKFASYLLSDNEGSSKTSSKSDSKIQSGNSGGSGGGGGDGDKKGGITALTTATSTAVNKILNNKEVQKTLERIKSGEGKYKEDGGIFENNQGKLPKASDGYYKERTVDTPGLNYRGQQRIVTGEKGEQYYTKDHYKTFIQIK